jgi:hypothetical protein
MKEKVPLDEDNKKLSQGMAEEIVAMQIFGFVRAFANLQKLIMTEFAQWFRSKEEQTSSPEACGRNRQLQSGNLVAVGNQD